MTSRAARLLTLVLGVAACSGPQTSPADSGPDGSASNAADLPFPVRLSAEQSKGRRVFAGVCASCHGLDGRGDTLATGEIAKDLPDLSEKQYGRLDSAQLAARFAAAHRTGAPARLTAGQIREVLSYLPVLAYPPDAPGSALDGRRLYGRYCISCHGVHGEGNGPAAALLSTRPTNFAYDTLVAARDFGALVRVTRDGPAHAHVSSMPAWGLFFNARMLQDVAAYLPTFERDREAAPSSSGSPPG
ncbi:MAG: c-type cytochrome [Gemmatimonadetes bacterium]|nr:c-type cytochrome [Gemmatimonadota bacterium]